MKWDRFQDGYNGRFQDRLSGIDFRMVTMGDFGIGDFRMVTMGDFGIGQVG